VEYFFDKNEFIFLNLSMFVEKLSNFTIFSRVVLLPIHFRSGAARIRYVFPDPYPDLYPPKSSGSIRDPDPQHCFQHLRALPKYILRKTLFSKQRFLTIGFLH
jgi:hypothetical protein